MFDKRGFWGDISKFRALKKCPRVILRALPVFLVKNNHNYQLKVYSNAFNRDTFN